MKLIRGSMLPALLVATGLWAGGAAAQTCSEGGCPVGPCVYHNHLVDSRFEQPSCQAWTHGGGSTLEFEVDECGTLLLSNMAVLGGADGQQHWERVHQTVSVPWGYSPSEVSFSLDIQGANRTSSDKLVVTIRDAATGAVLETVAQIPATSTALDCALLSKPLSGSYAGKTVRLYFQSTISSGSSTKFLIDGVSLISYF